MYNLLIYSLKVSVCIAVFYFFFKLILARETFHRLNRILILGAILASFLLPVCVITIYCEMPFVAESDMPVTRAVPTETAGFLWRTLAGIIYVAGIIAYLMWCAKSFYDVLKVIRCGKRKKLEDGIVLVLTDRDISPLSWCKYVIMTKKDWEESGNIILLHERAHIKMHHTADLMVTDLAGAMQWFNPAVWLLRRELRDIHEYEADKAVIQSGINAKDYQLMLIKKAVGKRWYSVTNSFNHNKLKKRITMMLSKKSSRWATAKTLFVLPLLLSAVYTFAETSYLYPKDKGTKIFAASKDTLNVEGIKEKIIADKALYVVNGKIVKSIENIKAEDIESITVRKDQEGLAKYGKNAEGKEGVIEITLKKRSDSEPEFN